MRPLEQHVVHIMAGTCTKVIETVAKTETTYFPQVINDVSWIANATYNGFAQEFWTYSVIDS